MLAATCTGCGKCGESHEPGLYVRLTADLVVCRACWEAMGRPWPSAPVDEAKVRAIELQARERMLKRGGADRYLVLKGRS